MPLHSLQAPYSILRPAVAGDVAVARQNGVGAIAYSPLFRGMLFGTWRGAGRLPRRSRGAHKDYLGARFQRHLQAIDEIRELAADSGLSAANSHWRAAATPGLTGCIVGARNARQGALIASLGVAVTDEQAAAVERISRRRCATTWPSWTRRRPRPRSRRARRPSRRRPRHRYLFGAT